MANRLEKVLNLILHIRIIQRVPAGFSVGFGYSYIVDIGSSFFPIILIVAIVDITKLKKWALTEYFVLQSIVVPSLRSDRIIKEIFTISSKTCKLLPPIQIIIESRPSKSKIIYAIAVALLMNSITIVFDQYDEMSGTTSVVAILFQIADDKSKRGTKANASW